MTRMKIKNVLLMALIVIFSLSVAGCSFIEKSPEAIKNEKVAKVGKDYITRGELDQIVNYNVDNMKANSTGYDDKYFATDQGKQTLLTIKQNVLNSMTEQKVEEQKATELKLFKDENEINDAAKKLIDEQIKKGKSDADFKKWLDDSKLTEDLLNKFAKMQVVSDKVYEYATKDAKVTEDDAKNYYNMNQTKYTEKPDTMEVSHILLKTEDEAKKIRERLMNGEDFATLAKENSIEEAAKTTGGSLGEIQYNDPGYDQTFVIAAMTLKEGEISQPILTQFGYHIIKVTKKTEYPVLAFDKVKEEITASLLKDQKDATYKKALDEWKTKAGIKILDKTLQAQAQK